MLSSWDRGRPRPLFLLVSRGAAERVTRVISPRPRVRREERARTPAIPGRSLHALDRYGAIDDGTGNRAQALPLARPADAKTVLDTKTRAVRRADELRAV